MNVLDSAVSQAFPSTIHGANLQPQSPGRSASDAGLQPSEALKGVKRRAPQACQSCRGRKIRCNVAKHGVPCTNCQIDEVVCVVGENKRKRKRITDNTSIALASGLSLSPGTIPHTTNDLAPAEGELNIYAAAADAALVPDPGVAPSNMQYSFQSPPPQQSAAFTRDLPRVNASTSPTTQALPILPTYIKPLPDRFEPDDITYLHNKGALTIPNDELRDELLQRYAEYMHPFMPLLNLCELMRVVRNDEQDHPVSLLLFQAVMFCGVAQADIGLLKAAGYSSRRDARRAFYNKTRLLYDLDYEDDPLALVQSLLLMTYWRERPNGRKETLHWIEIAVSQAQKICLHRNPEVSVPQLSRQRLWKRIWWSAYMRDAQIALGSRKATCITDVDWDVRMLELADFELDILPSAQSHTAATSEKIQDSEKQRQLAVMCIENAKLCLRIAYILSTRYGATTSKGSVQTAARLFANPLEPNGDHGQACDNALKEWQVTLPEEARYISPTMQDVQSGNTDLVIHRGFLHMLYYTALSALHRPHLLPSTRIPSYAVRPHASASRTAVQLAATSITTIIGTLQSLSLVRFLPSPTITVLLPPIVFHLTETLASGTHVQPSSVKDFSKCMHIMGELREMYAAADYSTAFLQNAIERTEIGPVALETDEGEEERSAITAPRGFTGQADMISSDPKAGQLSSMDRNVATNSSAPSSVSLINGDYRARRLTGDTWDSAEALPTMMTPSNGPGIVGSANGLDFNSDVNSTANNLGSAGQTFTVEDTANFAEVHGGRWGFPLNMDWMQGVGAGSALGGQGDW